MIKAIICDDENAAQNIIKHFLESANLPIEVVGTADNGRDALKLLKKEKPDLAFMDIQMPFMNCFEVIEQAGECKIIIITAYDSFEYTQKALRLGASDILSKPIDFEQLKAAINRAVKWQFTDNDLANNVLEYLHAHYGENVDIPTLAGMNFCSESHLSRVFKKATGKTVITYMNELRIKNSIDLMEKEDYTVTEACEAVGYRSENLFFNHFKKYTGMSPKNYMKNKKQSGAEKTQD